MISSWLIVVVTAIATNLVFRRVERRRFARELLVKARTQHSLAHLGPCPRRHTLEPVVDRPYERVLCDCGWDYCSDVLNRHELVDAYTAHVAERQPHDVLALATGLAGRT